MSTLPTDDVFFFRFTKRQLNSIPANERKFVFIAAHFLNEVHMLQKLAFHCTQNLASTEPHKSCQLAQAGMLARLTLGKLHEGNRQLSHFGGLLQSYAAPIEIAENRTELNTYFGNARTNRATPVRKNYAFHYSPDGLNDAFESCDDDAVFTAALSRGIGNTMMTFAEELAARGATKRVSGQMQFETSTVELLRETLPLARAFTAILQHYIGEIIERHSPGALSVDGAEQVSLKGLPTLVEISIPFLVRTR